MERAFGLAVEVNLYASLSLGLWCVLLQSELGGLGSGMYQTTQRRSLARGVHCGGRSVRFLSLVVAPPPPLPAAAQRSARCVRQAGVACARGGGMAGLASAAACAVVLVLLLGATGSAANSRGWCAPWHLSTSARQHEDQKRHQTQPPRAWHLCRRITSAAPPVQGNSTGGSSGGTVRPATFGPPARVQPD